MATNFITYLLIQLEWFMINDHNGQTSSTQPYAEVVFAKDNDTLIPNPEILYHDSTKKPFNDVNYLNKDKTHSSPSCKG